MSMCKCLIMIFSWDAFFIELFSRRHTMRPDLADGKRTAILPGGAIDTDQ
jgi:hypothetical protein